MADWSWDKFDDDEEDEEAGPSDGQRVCSYSCILFLCWTLVTYSDKYFH